MGKLEDFYINQEKAAEEKENERCKRNARIWNEASDVIKDVVNEIMKRKEIQHPEKCEWIEIDGARHIAWKIYSWSDGWDEHGDYYLLIDGRFASEYKRNFRISGAFDHYDTLYKSPFNDDSFSIVNFMNALIKFAVEKFGVVKKGRWKLRSIL